MLRQYYHLIKPGIVRGNAITAAAGFFLASKGGINWALFFAMLVGISLVMASACVFNNYIDKDIDKKMARTQKRALVTGDISDKRALIFGATLGICGFTILLIYTNFLTACIAAIGFIAYVVIYGIWKRRSEYGTLVGSISGAVPPLVGYLSVTNNMDSGAWLLFFILVLWQMPHFYAIGIFRLKEYKAARIPVLPAVKGVAYTKKHIIGYVVAFLLLVPFLTIEGYTGLTYLAVMIPISLWWLQRGLQSSTESNDEKWARGMFGVSLAVLLLFSVTISISYWVP